MNDGDHIVVQRLAVALQRFRAFLAGLARRDADLDDLTIGKKAHRLSGTDQAAPVEVRSADRVDLTLGVPRAACDGTNRVTGLLGQQRIVAPHDVERSQVLLQVRYELIVAQLHGVVFVRVESRSSGRRRGGQPAHHLFDDVALK